MVCSLSRGRPGPREPEGGHSTLSPQESEHGGGLVLKPTGRPHPTRIGSAPRAGGHRGIYPPVLQAGSDWQGRRHHWSRREPSTGRRGQGLSQQQVHWGGLRGHQETAVSAAGVSTQTPSSGLAQACLDVLCLPNTKSDSGPPLKLLLPILCIQLK